MLTIQPHSIKDFLPVPVTILYCLVIEAGVCVVLEVGWYEPVWHMDVRHQLHWLPACQLDNGLFLNWQLSR